MKYAGWILLFLTVTAGVLFYFLRYQPLTEAYTKQKEEIELWVKKVEELEKSKKDSIKEGISVSLKDSLLWAIGTDSLFVSLKKDDISESGKKILDRIAEELKKSDKEILILVHTDAVPVGPSLKKLYPTNWELSTRRASVIARYLIKKGVPAERIIAGGCGPARPLGDNKTEEGRKRNRRVEIYVR